MIVEVIKEDPQLYKQFNNLLQEGNVMVLYYADWCPHCVSMKPSWDSFKKQCESNPKYKHLKVAEVESSHIHNTLAVNEAEGFPTIKFYKANKTNSKIAPETINFDEERTSDNLLNFTVNKFEQLLSDTKTKTKTNKTKKNKPTNKTKKNKLNKKTKQVKSKKNKKKKQVKTKKKKQANNLYIKF